MSHPPLMDTFTYWVAFVVDIKNLSQQQFCGGAFTFFYPLDDEQHILMATDKIEGDRQLPPGSVTVWDFKRIS